MNTVEMGKFSEEVARRYLIKKGFSIICSNYHSRFGEIDIIAQNGEYLVFVEVRMRKSGSVVSPAESVDTKKQRKLIKTAIKFLSENPTNLQPRFDVLEIKRDNTKFYINHLSNAFYLEDGYAPF